MVEKLEESKPDMDEDQLLAVLLDQIVANAKQDVAEAINLCAIPHWFNEQILSFLRNESEISKRTRIIFSRLKALGLAVPYDGQIWTYHPIIRDTLLKKWRRTKLSLLKQLNLRLSEFYKDNVDQRFEFIYHLLAGDDSRGFELLIGEILHANRFYFFSTSERLLYLARDPSIKLSRPQQNRLEYYRAELAAISGYWDEALPILRLLKRRKLPENLRAKVFLRLGTVYNRRGQWTYAINQYRKSLGYGESADASDRAWASSGLGLIYARQGEWKKAKECHDRAMRTAKEKNDQLWHSRAINNIGEIYQQTGKLEKAKDYYQESILEKKELGDQYGLLWTYINLGSLYLELDQLSKASQMLTRSFEMALELQSPGEEARALEHIGALKTIEGDFDQAHKFYKQALGICQRINEPHTKANILFKMGISYQKEDKLTEAASVLKKAHTIYKKLKSFKASEALKEYMKIVDPSKKSPKLMT